MCEAALGPKQRTLTVMQTEQHNLVFPPCCGLAYLPHRNAVFLVLTVPAGCFAVSGSREPALPGKAVGCDTPSTARACSRGFVRCREENWSRCRDVVAAALDTLQRAFGADPSVREGSFTSEQSWSDTPTAYTHRTEISL